MDAPMTIALEKNGNVGCGCVAACIAEASCRTLFSCIHNTKWHWLALHAPCQEVVPDPPSTIPREVCTCCTSAMRLDIDRCALGMEALPVMPELQNGTFIGAASRLSVLHRERAGASRSETRSVGSSAILASRTSLANGSGDQMWSAKFNDVRTRHNHLVGEHKRYTHSDEKRETQPRAHVLARPKGPGMALNSADTPDQDWGLDTDNVLSP